MLILKCWNEWAGSFEVAVDPNRVAVIRRPFTKKNDGKAEQDGLPEGGLLIEGVLPAGPLVIIGYEFHELIQKITAAKFQRVAEGFLELAKEEEPENPLTPPA